MDFTELDIELAIGLIITLMGSSSFVALLNWRRDRKKNYYTNESLATESLSTALTHVRADLADCRQQLEEFKDH